MRRFCWWTACAVLACVSDDAAVRAGSSGGADAGPSFPDAAADAALSCASYEPYLACADFEIDGGIVLRVAENTEGTGIAADLVPGFRSSRGRVLVSPPSVLVDAGARDSGLDAGPEFTRPGVASIDVDQLPRKIVASADVRFDTVSNAERPFMSLGYRDSSNAMRYFTLRAQGTGQGKVMFASVTNCETADGGQAAPRATIGRETPVDTWLHVEVRAGIDFKSLWLRFDDDPEIELPGCPLVGNTERQIHVGFPTTTQVVQGRWRIAVDNLVVREVP
jgi:hypothetical protein